MSDSSNYTNSPDSDNRKTVTVHRVVEPELDGAVLFYVRGIEEYDSIIMDAYEVNQLVSALYNTDKSLKAQVGDHLAVPVLWSDGQTYHTVTEEMLVEWSERDDN